MRRLPPLAASGLIILLVPALCLALRSGIALNHDAAWLMVAADRLLAGGRYATDFFEVNMPQAIALYAPPQWLHSRLGLSASVALMLWTLALVVQGLLLIAAIGANSGNAPLRAMASPWWLSWLAFGLIVLPGNDFGQREHLAVILALPFVFMLAADETGLSAALRSYIALLAGIGLFTKPHFALLPWLLLIRAGGKGARSPLRSPELLALVAVALVEALVLALRFPDWFTCARWAGDLYGAFRQPSFWYQLEDSSVIATTIAFALLAMAVWRSGSRAGWPWPFFTAALYSAAVYLLQGKGWPYQFLPAMLFLFAAVLPVWVLTRSTARKSRSRLAYTPVVAAMVVLLAQAVVAIRAAPRAADMPHSLIGTALSAARKGDSVYVFSTSVATAFPTIVDLDLGWASRYSALWPLAGLAEALQSSDPREHLKLVRYAQPLADAVNADFQRYRPSIVIVDHRLHQFGLPPRFDILGFFLRDPAFRQTWSAYEQIGASSDFDIYRDRSHAQDPLPPGWAVSN